MLKREFSAGGIVVKKQEKGFNVLLIKDSYGRWTWPKGHVDKGESSREAALREVTEEVGLTKIQILKKIGQNQYFYKRSGKLIFKTVYLFLIEARGEEKLKVQTEEIQTAKWFIPAQALPKVKYKGAHRLLQKAQNLF